MKTDWLCFFLGIAGIFILVVSLITFNNSVYSFLSLFLSGISIGYCFRYIDEIVSYSLNKNQDGEA